MRWGGVLTQVSRKKEPTFREKEIGEQEQTTCALWTDETHSRYQLVDICGPRTLRSPFQRHSQELLLLKCDTPIRTSGYSELLEVG